MERKKYLILLILKILESNTDERHPMRLKEIESMISDSMPCDRKTVGRNVKFLKEVGYPIEKTSKGYYVKQKRFTLDEVDFIKTAVKTADDRAGIDKDKLSEKLASVLVKMLEYRE